MLIDTSLKTASFVYKKLAFVLFIEIFWKLKLYELQ